MSRRASRKSSAARKTGDSKKKGLAPTQAPEPELSPGLHVHPSFIRWTAIVLATLAILAVTACLNPGVRKQLRLSFTRTATPYTEMYFSQPASLPTLLTPGVTTVVPVTIGNHKASRQPFTYTYSVTVAGANSAVQSTKLSYVTIGAGRSAQVNVAVEPLRPSNDYLVTIVLKDEKNVELHFKAGSK